MKDPTPEEDALAAELVDEALEGFETVFTPEMLEIVRAMLESELVATKRGRQRLRDVMNDPKVAKSDDVVKDGVSKTRGKASGDE